MNTRFTVTQLERMTTHELADLLGNIVILLKRLPDVECKLLEQVFPDSEPITAEEAPVQTTSSVQPQKKYTATELKAKKSPELKDIAKELHLTFAAKATKDVLIGKILAYQEQGYSDQFAIQHL
jgi:Rho termination factor, N-terminal domain